MSNSLVSNKKSLFSQLKPFKHANIVNPYKIAFIHNSYALEQQMPITFDIFEGTMELSGADARETYERVQSIDNMIKYDAVQFSDDKKYTLTQIDLRTWDHKQFLKIITNQAQLNMYLNEIFVHNKKILSLYPHLIECKCIELGVVFNLGL